MKRFWTIFTAAILSLALLFAISFSSLADFGDFSGDTDWGGGSSWGGSSWDSDIWDSDDDYSGGYISGATTGAVLAGDGEDSVLSTILVVIIIAAIIFFVLRKGKSGSAAPRVNVQVQETAVAHTMDELKAVDPNFSEEALKEKISNLYVQLQNGWQAKDISSLQNTMTDAFFNQMDRQLDAYRQSGRTNKIERIAVLGVQLKGYNEDEVNTTVVANLTTRIVDYVVDDKTGAIVKGSNTAEKFMTYEWTMVRSKGVLTGTNAGTTSVHCPSCGAPLNVNFSAKCEYCGAVIQTSEYDWVLSGMKGLSQQTNG